MKTNTVTTALSRTSMEHTGTPKSDLIYTQIQAHLLDETAKQAISLTVKTLAAHPLPPVFRDVILNTNELQVCFSGEKCLHDHQPGQIVTR